MEQAQQISFLKKIQFFSNFDDHELRQFLSVSKWLKVPKNTLIIKEDTMERVFYILVRGEVSVFKTNPDGGSFQLTTLSTGDCFGEMSLVTDIRRTAGVITTMESYILMVEPDIISTSNVFLQLKFFKRFCEVLVARLIMANDRVIGKMASQDGRKPPETKEQTKPAIKQIDNDRDRRLKAEMSATSIPPTPVETEKKKVSPKPVLSASLSIPPMPDKPSRISKARLEREIRSDISLPVNPAVAAQLNVYRSGECDNTRAFADLICLDPVLAARVLQIANSSLYRRSCAVATVPHAMIAVGIHNIQQTVADTIDASHHVEPFSGFSVIAKTFWKHSIVVGRIAELLKDIIRVSIPSDAYLAGLVHDIGVLPLDAFETAFYPQLLRPNSDIKRDQLEAEREYIGTDHGQAGAWIAEKFGLPEGYIDVMRFHHTPEKARDNILLVALVHLANIFAISRGICIGGPDCNTIDPLESFAWVIIQEQHKQFIEVNVTDFIESFNNELTKTWDHITGNIPL